MVTKKLIIVVEADEVEFYIKKIFDTLGYKKIKFISFTKEEIKNG